MKTFAMVMTAASLLTLAIAVLKVTTLQIAWNDEQDVSITALSNRVYAIEQKLK